MRYTAPRVVSLQTDKTDRERGLFVAGRASPAVGPFHFHASYFLLSPAAVV